MCTLDTAESKEDEMQVCERQRERGRKGTYTWGEQGGSSICQKEARASTCGHTDIRDERVLKIT